MIVWILTKYDNKQPPPFVPEIEVSLVGVFSHFDKARRVLKKLIKNHDCEWHIQRNFGELIYSNDYGDKFIVKRWKVNKSS